MAKRTESRGDRLKRYRTYLDHAKRYRDEEGYDDLWGRMIDLYRGKQVVELTPEDRIVVNIAFSTINVVFPSVSVNYPKITVAPTKPEDEDRAVILEALVNYFWRHYDYQPEFRLATKDYLIIGHGWMKIGYSFAEREVPVNPLDLDDELSSAVAEAETYATENPAEAHLVPNDDEIREHLSTSQKVVEHDEPFVERVSPFDMFVDPAATSLREARWIAQRIVRPLTEVRKDERYNAGVRRAVRGDMESRTERDERQRRKRDRHTPDMQYATLWEFYDLATQETCTWAEGVEGFLVDPKPQPYGFGHPYVQMRNYDVPEHFYPMGDLEAVESLQLELNKTRSQHMQARKKFARKYLYRESAFDAMGRQALESDRDNTLVPVADDSRPFQDIIEPLSQVQLPPDLYQHSQQVEQDIALVSGVSEYQQGQVPETRRTATEAAIISDSVTARAADKLAVIERALANTARKVVQVTQQYTTGEQVFRVQGIDKAMLWVPWTRDDIRGEYDFEVEAGSTQPQNETVRRQTAIALTQALAPFAEIVNPIEMVRHLLQFGFGISNPEKFLMMPQQPPGPGGAEPGGVGGMQDAPMGGGYIDQDTGNTAHEEQQLQSAVPPEIAAQLRGQVGLNL